MLHLFVQSCLCIIIIVLFLQCHVYNKHHLLRFMNVFTAVREYLLWCIPQLKKEKSPITKLHVQIWTSCSSWEHIKTDEYKSMFTWSLGMPMQMSTTNANIIITCDVTIWVYILFMNWRRSHYTTIIDI